MTDEDFERLNEVLNKRLEEAEEKRIKRKTALDFSRALGRLDREEFIHSFKSFMYYEFGEFMPCKFEKMVNGSACHLFDDGISTETIEFNAYVFGDVDVMFPLEYKERLESYIKVQFTDRWLPQAQNSSKYYKIIEYTIGLNEIKLVVQYDSSTVGVIEFEVDFIFTRFENNVPDDFSKFAWSVAWDELEDTKAGIFHKNYIRACCHILHPLDGFLCTPKSEVNKIRLSKNQPGLWKYAFSVTKGLREKYALEDYTVDDRDVYKGLSSKECSYDRDLDSIFTKIFGVVPTEKDKAWFWLFMGLSQFVRSRYGAKIENDIYDEAERLTDF